MIRNPILFEAHSFQISLASNGSDAGELHQKPYLRRKLNLDLRFCLITLDQEFAV
jgi:hypothetical protein